jgi:hypothetical protein
MLTDNSGTITLNIMVLTVLIVQTVLITIPTIIMGLKVISRLLMILLE